MDRIVLSRESLQLAFTSRLPKAWPGRVRSLSWHVAVLCSTWVNLFRAYRAMANLAVTWLRAVEIFFSGAFLLLWIIFMVFESSDSIALPLMFAAGLVGLLNASA
jgi:hypothetical protein